MRLEFGRTIFKGTVPWEIPIRFTFLNSKMRSAFMLVIAIDVLELYTGEVKKLE